MTRLYHLDILRMLAILCIIVRHLPSHGFLLFLDNIKEYFALVGLGLFFFMSGYLLNYNYKSLNSWYSKVNFYKKRVIRIYPLYWIFLFVYVFLYVFIAKDASHITLTVTDLIIYIIGLHMFFSNYIPLIPFLWFIGVIIIFYLLYPFLIRSSTNFANNRSILFNSILIFIIFILLRLTFNVIDDLFFMYYFIFIGGILSTKYENMKIRKYILPSFFLILITSQLSNPTVKNNFILYTVFSDVFMLSSIIILWSLSIKYSDIIQKFLKKIPSNISFAGYSIYLLHPIALMFFYYFLNFIHLNYILLRDLFIVFFGLPVILIIGYNISLFENLVKNSFVDSVAKNGFITQKIMKKIP
jgi:peptidoglycan/LPS O-acetylase OafA/YrhL